MMYSRYNLDLDHKIPAQAWGRSQKLTVSLNTVIKEMSSKLLFLYTSPKIVPGDGNKFLFVDYRELSIIAKTRGIIDERGNSSIKGNKQDSSNLEQSYR